MFLLLPAPAGAATLIDDVALLPFGLLLRQAARRAAGTWPAAA
jgi:hypothetical protein